MSQFLDLVLGEWFKLRRRWLPWTLLGTLALACTLVVWASLPMYLSLQRMQDALPGAQGSMAEIYAGIRAPASLLSAYSVAGSLGLIVCAILTATIFGTDHGLGTLRPILLRGTGRLPYLAAKLAAVIGLCGGALLSVGLLTTVSSSIAGALVEPPPGGAAVSATWADALRALLTTWLALIPYIVATAAVTTLSRSAAAGMGISLVYYFVEAILAAVLTSQGNAGFARVAGALLIQNINAFSGSGFVGVGGGGATAGHPALVLALYTVAFAAITALVFSRRDIHGPSGA